MASGKIIVSLMSVLLLVAIVIGVVVVVNNNGSHNKDSKGGGGGGGGTVATSTKAATSICSFTQHKDACINSLGNVAKNDSATPKDFIFAIIESTITEVNKSLAVAQSVKLDDKKEYENMGLDDCKKCLQFALDDLQTAVSMVRDSDFNTITSRTFDLQNWFTAVAAYKETCLDEVQLPDYRSPVENGMVNATQLTSNALYILSELDNILASMGIKIEVAAPKQDNATVATKAANRRLLEATELGDDGYPTWFSAADRKLLAALDKNAAAPRKRGGHRKGGHHKKGPGGKAGGRGGRRGKGGHRKKKAAAAAGGAAVVGAAAGAAAVGGAVAANAAPAVVPAGGSNPGAGVKPNAIVALDGSGQFKSIAAAIAAVPAQRQGRWVIYVKAGIYNEHIVIPKDKTDILMYGDGRTKTIVSGALSFPKVQTMQSATFAVEAARFIGKGMGFRNTAGPQGHQAVAFRSQSDMSAMFDCSFEAYQDTLYYHTNRQFYKNCVIMGTVDFIFGRGIALIQDSDIIVRMPMDGQKNTITADGNTEPRGVGGLVLQGCHIMAEKPLLDNKAKFPTYFGRPWSAMAVTAITESNIEDFIHPEGYMIWQGNNNHQTATYVEYQNTNVGGTQVGGRVKWSKVRINNAADANRFTAGVHLEGGAKPVKWVMETGVPAYTGLKATK